MFVFKIAFIIFVSTLVLSATSHIAKQENYFRAGLACLYLASGVLTGKILYDRYQHIHILGSLTPNPNVTQYVNKIASISVSFLSLGFLSYLLLLLFKNDEITLKALSIFLCGLGTSYMWLQCLLTTYISTLFYEKRLTLLRQGLANLSFLFLILMAIFGTLSVFLPVSESSVLYICNVITSLSSYVLTIIFCLFILTFEREYKYFSEGIRSNMLIDDTCSSNNASLEDVESLLESHEQTSMIRRILPRTGLS